MVIEDAFSENIRLIVGNDNMMKKIDPTGSKSFEKAFDLILFGELKEGEKTGLARQNSYISSIPDTHHSHLLNSMRNISSPACTIQKRTKMAKLRKNQQFNRVLKIMKDLSNTQSKMERKIENLKQKHLNLRKLDEKDAECDVKYDFIAEYDYYFPEYNLTRRLNIYAWVLKFIRACLASRDERL